ncbi:DUF6384 family protein [Yersinia alsatica]|uniref:DUF6384 family protein n=1 Tax=Yersinia alsatica TaxID=2890317 RepID=A0ABY5UKZ3_9GAMM|nr:DUF6384 family protein [Yersinia alsatica]OWF68586.1 hypothetical protein B4901_11935 [Yersinia frederiksenii]UWM44126.1 DUF6384 family protein [Yersinia alsatica]CNK94349.1 Uncharacterised protein [Yersinia frederiksenii]CNL11115.1 Uncharacterised protein [Yersinia frederiksenii]
MNEIKLRDQLGAMAIIDSLYAQQIALEEHLDLPKLRQRIAQRIRDYYQSTGVSISDELIEQGVTSWFDNRLRFQSNKMNASQRMVAFLHMTSKKWLTSLSIIVLLLVIGVGINIYVGKNQLAALEKDIASQVLQNSALTTQAQQLSTQIDNIKLSHLNYAAQSAHQIIAKAKSVLDDFHSTQQAIEPSYQGTFSSKENSQHYLSALSKGNEQQTSLLTQAQDLVDSLPRLQKMDETLNQITQDPNLKLYTQRAPEIASILAGATLALSRNAENVAAQVDAAFAAYDKEQTRESLYQSMDRRTQDLRNLPLSPQDRAIIAEQIAEARKMLVGVDLVNIGPPSAWVDAMKELEQTYDFIKQPLSLIIIDRVGEKSGVERTYDISNGRSWYLIVEPVTPGDKLFPMMVKDSETGEQKLVSKFGVRVSQNEYEKLRRDKQDDGHIDNNIVGNKPANQLSFKFTRPVQDGRITTW